MNDAVAKSAGTVLILCPGGLLEGGGIGRQIGYFLQAYQPSGQSIDYRVIDTRGPWFLGESPRHTISAAAYLLRAASEMVAVRLRNGPCLAHVNITGRGSTVRKLILLTLAHAIGLRYILHIHDPDYAADYRHRGKLAQFLVSRMFRRAEAVFVLGQHDKVLLAPLLGLLPANVVVLHNAVPDPRPNLPKLNGRPTCQLLFLGHLSARKGVPELLRAMAITEVAALPWTLTLAGGGPVDEFRSLADELGIGERVDFPGWLDSAAVHQACEHSDILVLPSHAEGLAMSVLEGLAHGLAVVATPVGAHAEVISPNVSGLFVPPGDVQALAIAMRRLLEDNELRAQLQIGARARFLEQFDIGVYAERLSEMHMAWLNKAGVGAHPNRPGSGKAVTMA